MLSPGNVLETHVLLPQTTTTLENVRQTTTQKEETHAKMVSRVRFGFVHVHSHPIILGDNPSVSSGAPLALGWTRIGEAETCDVDAYEASHDSNRPSSTQLKLSAGLRQRRLQQAGVKYGDLMRRMEQCDAWRQEHYESMRRAATAKKARPSTKNAKSNNNKLGGRVAKFWQRLFARA